MEPIQYTKFLGEKVIEINDKKIILPSLLKQVDIVNNKIIIIFGGGVISDEILNSQELLLKHWSELNHNIWCFDFEGHLLWKIPSAYTEEQHQENIKKDGVPLPAAYQGFIRDLNDEKNIIAYNAYADYLFVRISDGAIVKKEKRGK